MSDKQYCKFIVKNQDETLIHDIEITIPHGIFYISVENGQRLLNIIGGTTFIIDEEDQKEIEEMIVIEEGDKSEKVKEQQAKDPKEVKSTIKK